MNRIYSTPGASVADCSRTRNSGGVCSVLACAALLCSGCITRHYHLEFYGDSPVTITVSGEVASDSTVSPKGSVPVSLKHAQPQGVQPHPKE